MFTSQQQLKLAKIVARTAICSIGPFLQVRNNGNSDCDSPFVPTRARMNRFDNDDLEFEKFVEHLQNGNSRGKAYVVFNTAAHKFIFKILNGRSDSLSSNRFEGQDGSSCSLLQGPRGIGKSEMLVAFQDYCKMNYPNIIPIYINYSDLSSKFSLLRNHTIFDIVRKELQAIRIEVISTMDGELEGQQVAEALENSGKYVLLLVDGIDELYRVKENKNADYRVMHQTCKWSLGDLNWLGNQKTGRFAVLLCGSSASCPLLITLDADRNQFQLQDHSPYLNATKFRTRRLPVNAFLDTEVFAQMLAHFLPDSTMKQGRLIRFYLGLSPMLFPHLAKAIEKDGDISRAFHSSNQGSGIEWAVSPIARTFRDRILSAMRERNREVFELIKDDDAEEMVSACKIMEVDWIPLFVPLTIEEVKSVWVAVNDNKPLSYASLKEMQATLFFLSDNAQVSFSDYGDDGLPQYIYPMNGAQVFVRP